MLSSFCGWSLDCNQVARPGWGHHVFNFLLSTYIRQSSKNLALIELMIQHLVSILYLVYKLCLNHVIGTTSLLVTFSVYYHCLWGFQVIKKVVQLLRCLPKLHEGLSSNLNKTIVVIKGYGLSK